MEATLSDEAKLTETRARTRELTVLDLDHDGTGDIVIAAPYASPGGVSNAGSIYVLWGKPAWNGTTTYSLSSR